MYLITLEKEVDRGVWEIMAQANVLPVAGFTEEPPGSIEYRDFDD